MLADLTPGQAALADAMSAISEDAWNASWMDGREAALWQAVESGASHYGRFEIGQARLDELKRLSDDCGGWIVFDDALEETFMPWAEWHVLRAERSRPS